MPTNLRRLLNHLPLSPSGRGAIYIRSTWHKPSLYDPLLSQPPFRPLNKLRADHFGRGLRRRQIVRGILRWSVAFGAAWVIFESASAFTLF